MEGISHEACSFAGTLGLGKLIVLYDDNGISIDGKVAGWFADDTPKRFEAYGWHVLPDVDGQDGEAVAKALRAAREETSRPSLICCKTIIGFGAPDKQGTKEAHGEALGAEEVAAARQALGWRVPAVRGARGHCAPPGTTHRRARRVEGEWQELFARYRAALSRAGRRVRAAHAGRAAGELGRDTRRQPSSRSASRARPQATRAVLAGRAQRARSGAAGAVRRLGRPHRLEQHPVQGRRDHHGRRGDRRLPALRRARVRHDRDDERHRAARRLHPLRRHVPGVLRLRAQRRAPGLPDAASA